MTEEIKEIFYKLRSDDYYEKHYQQSVYYEKDLIKLENYITNLQKEKDNYKQRNENAVENAKEKIKKYESYIHDLKNGNYPSPTIRQERQELIFRIREQEDLLNILQGGDE